MRFKLSRDEVRCLQFVATEGASRISDIVAARKISKVQLSRTISSLTDKGFLSTEKEGLSKKVSFSETRHAALFRNLILEFDHMPWDKLLSGGNLEALAAICSKPLTNRMEIAENSLISEATAALDLEDLRAPGIIQRIDTYKINPRFKVLQEFVIEFRRYMNQKFALEFASDAVILWEHNLEFIIECSKTQGNDSFLLTGASAFPRFGVQLMAPKSQFFHSPFAKRLRLEDAIAHSLLVPNGSLIPTLLVWRKNVGILDMKYLIQTAGRYGVANSVAEISRYFDSQGIQRPDRFPKWSEFLIRAKEYGIH